MTTSLLALVPVASHGAKTGWARCARGTACSCRYQFPEWFVTTDGRGYRVTDVRGGAVRTHSAAEMRRGIPVDTRGDSELRLRVDPTSAVPPGPGAP